MDELLQNALVRRERLRAELAAIEEFIKGYSEALNVGAENPSAGDLFKIPRKRKGTRPHRTEQIDAAVNAAEQIVLEAGRPLSRTALLRRLEERGHLIDGTDKAKVLGTNLWRSKRFYNLKGAGYWPINEPIPEEFANRRKWESSLLEGGNDDDLIG